MNIKLNNVDHYIDSLKCNNTNIDILKVNNTIVSYFGKPSVSITPHATGWWAWEKKKWVDITYDFPQTMPGCTLEANFFVRRGGTYANGKSENDGGIQIENVSMSDSTHFSFSYDCKKISDNHWNEWGYYTRFHVKRGSDIISCHYVLDYGKCSNP